MNENDVLDEQIFQILLENPCQNRAQIKDALDQVTARRVNASINRLISASRILPQGYWQPSKTNTLQSTIKAFMIIKTGASASLRMGLQNVLDQHQDIGQWKYLSSGQSDFDYVFLLFVNNDDPRLAELYTELQKMDDVTTHTNWIIDSLSE